MTCQVITLPDGSRAIVCGARGRKDQVCACGRQAALLCDWKVGKRRCDAPICATCTFSPALNKDLCPAHARAYAEWRARQAAKAGIATPAPTPAPHALGYVALQHDLFGGPRSSPSTTRGAAAPVGPTAGVRGATPRPRSIRRKRRRLP